ncbi:hypothetical protein [Agrococcus casei]|uniref:Uncharacterized protein n=1 Tax=Agrococcus casei LMG 22410 TaxID=1255656 RepID=A0A1R4ER41_9MICO|nr:hypothetical protein [Agrococcus casei]SJM46135.1 hypothetical protein CZ674_00320 [Agrococcus casei LMG 22410]
MNENRPTFRDRMKPTEYLGFAAVAAIFTGLVVLLVSRNWLLVTVFALVAFVVCLITLATLLLVINKDIDKNKLEAAKREEEAGE